MKSELEELSTSELLSEAGKIRDRSTGSYITYSPKVFIALTMLCNDSCGYCTFVKRPWQVSSPYMSLSEVQELVRRGVEANCHEALFTLGERPEQRWGVAKTWLADNGFESTVDYLAQVASTTLHEFGLLPHINAGALNRDELARLREVSVSQGMMLESIRSDLDCHRGSPDKTPQRRLATLRFAGELAIPFTTGLLVGIGDSEADRIQALRAIADISNSYGNIQEVIIQNFLPKSSTRFANTAPCDPEEFLRTIALARIILPIGVHLQAPPNLFDDVTSLICAGIDDLGGISPITIDHVNPEKPWPHLDKLARQVQESGFSLVPRLGIYPPFATGSKKWLDPKVRFRVMEHCDASGFAREDFWVSGGDQLPPDIFDTSDRSPSFNLYGPRTLASSGGGELAELLQALERGHQPDKTQIELLFSARGHDVLAIAELADAVRADVVGDDVTFVKNRNINYTNICTFKCRFCAFSKGPLSLNLRGTPYLLSSDQLAEKVAAAAAAGATEVCLQGGIHPSFDGDYYLGVIRTVKAAAPDIHIHGFSALEIFEGSRRLQVELPTYLIMLKEAGLKTLPGTAAEILDDKIRAELCPDKINTEQWLEVHRQAHKVGLRSNVTIMFGAVETPSSWATHIVATRELQQETGGFTEFVPLPFVHMASPIYLQHKARRGPTFREAVLMHAIGRLAYSGSIDNIQASWVKMGIPGAQVLLRSGANDLGGTLMEENISRAAGASHGQVLEIDDFFEIITPIRRSLVQRTTLYDEITRFDSTSRLPVS